MAPSPCGGQLFALVVKKNRVPQIEAEGRDFPVVTCANVPLDAALLCSSGGNQLAIDDPKSVGKGSALKSDRLIVGAVDMNDLVWIQVDPNTRRRGHAGVHVRPIPDDRANDAATFVRLIERYDALVAKRR